MARETAFRGQIRGAGLSLRQFCFFLLALDFKR